MRHVIIALGFAQSLQAQNLLRMEGYREPLERLEVSSLLSWSVLSGKWVPGLGDLCGQLREGSVEWGSQARPQRYDRVGSFLLRNIEGGHSKSVGGLSH